MKSRNLNAIIWTLGAVFLAYLLLILPYEGWSGLGQALLFFWLILPISAIIILIALVREIMNRRRETPSNGNAPGSTQSLLQVAGTTLIAIVSIAVLAILSFLFLGIIDAF